MADGNKLSKKKCIACGGLISGKPLLVFENMPASAQDIPDYAELSKDCGINLNLHQCRSCGLVQFDCEPVDYYRDVIRSGGFSTTMVELRRSQYEHLITKYQLQGKKFIEVGCGRGEFLSVLGQFPVEGYGIEHRDDLVRTAREQGLSVWQGFAESTEMKLNGDMGNSPYDVFLSFNFLEHQPDPVTMLRCIGNNLSDDGMGLITAPSLEYILEHNGYYELIRDHLAYYTFDTLRYVLLLGGFEVLEEELVNRDTLSVIVKKAGKRELGEIKPVYCPIDVSGLVQSRSLIDHEVNDLVDRLHRQNKSLAIWGASHQGFTLASTTRLGDKVLYMIDSAPFKQGRYAPGSHIPIVSPEHFMDEPADAILIVAPGYTEEIAVSIRERFGMDVQILTLRSSHIESL